MSASILPAPLSDAIRHATFGIWYVPIGNEPDPSSAIFPETMRATIPPSAAVDPVELAKNIVDSHVGDVAYILIPGRQFDRSGTRHGRGAGWYDRFLSAIPHEWIRIGVTRQQDISESMLVREPWDEPVDWLLIASNGSWAAHKTSARE